MIKYSWLSTSNQFKLYINNLRYIYEMLQLIHVYYMPYKERAAILNFSEGLRGLNMPFLAFFLGKF